MAITPLVALGKKPEVLSGSRTHEPVNMPEEGVEGESAMSWFDQ